MNRTREDVIADLNKAQEKFDSAVMDIGLLHYPFHKSSPDKVDEAREAELELQKYQAELAHYPQQ